MKDISEKERRDLEPVADKRKEEKNDDRKKRTAPRNQRGQKRKQFYFTALRKCYQCL